MLLQVHDEIIVDVHPGEIDEVTAIVTEEMGSAFELDVPARRQRRHRTVLARRGPLSSGRIGPVHAVVQR